MPDDRIPFIVFGDGPRLASGLARIARDLTARLHIESEELGIRVIQMGIDFPTGYHWQAWDFYGFQESKKSYGREELTDLLSEFKGGPQPIVFMVTDPARCFDLIRPPSTPKEANLLDQVDFWGYFPIDSHNIQGAVGGPAQQTVQACERIMAYGRYGARVLRQTLAQGTNANPAEVKVPSLPHGLEPGVWRPTPLDAADDGFRRWAEVGGSISIGCVATNQPRKDLGLFFATLAELRQHGHDPKAWLHTDLLTRAWDVGQLAYDFGIPKDKILVSTGNLTDQQLAARYSWADVTIAPGLGEGFGYPIVESLGCGTPVIHGDYAGGAELVPNRDWLITPTAWRLESCYGLQRPVFNPQTVAEMVVKTAQWAQDPASAAYCSNSVRYLWWDQLWPRWRSWIAKGLEGHRARSAA